MIIFGTRLYGKVDHVPGLFYVATKFFHVQFVPLVPAGSFLIIDDGSERGVAVGVSGKSILVAWLRAALVVGAIVAVVLGVMALSEGGESDKVSAMFALAGAAGLVALFWGSYRWTHAGEERAAELAEQVGIDPGVVRARFADHVAHFSDDYGRERQDN